MSHALSMHKQAASRALKTFLRQPLGSLLILVMLGIALTLPLALYLVVQSNQQMLGQLTSTPQITVFMALSAEQKDVDALQAELRKRHELSKIEYVSKQKALADMQQSMGEQDLVSMLDENPLPDAFVLTPKAELEGEMGDSLPGLQARLMSQALRKLTATIKKTNCTVIFINQIRMKIGVMFGSPETTTGGNALKFYASVRLDIRRTGTIKKGDVAIGNETKVKVVKNKVSPPFKTAEFDILFGEGISREGEIIDMGANAKVLDKSGAWYAYNGEKIGQGRDNAREFLRENPDLAREIENKVRESLGIAERPAALAGGAEADEA